MTYNIAVVGTGYVGLVAGVCLADAGHAVTCVDIDAAKVRRMVGGEIPIYEPGLLDVFKRVLSGGGLTLTTSLADGVAAADIVFLALPTPPNDDGSADLSAVLAVADQLGPLLSGYTVIVDKSTVPVGTGELVEAAITATAASGAEFDVVSNPEFLREGLALHDFVHPDRVVIGCDSRRASDMMAALYRPLVDDPQQIITMDRRSAELTKYAANSFLAMKVSFMNEMANLAEQLGADVEAVRQGIGPDERIGRRFLQAGIGFGGSCFPKDVLALHKTSVDNDYDFKLLRSILEVNTLQKQRLVEKILAHYAGELDGKRFGLWGLAFKPDTDDIREAPALVIIDELLARGANVCAYDPEAMDNVRRRYKGNDSLTFAASALAAATGADALIIATEWEEFRTPDLATLRSALATPLIFDGRNLYEPADMAAAGFGYSAIGRPSLLVS